MGVSLVVGSGPAACVLRPSSDSSAQLDPPRTLQPRPFLRPSRTLRPRPGQNAVTEEQQRREQAELAGDRSLLCGRKLRWSAGVEGMAGRGREVGWDVAVGAWVGKAPLRPAGPPLSPLPGQSSCDVGAEVLGLVICAVAVDGDVAV